MTWFRRRAALATDLPPAELADADRESADELDDLGADALDVPRRRPGRIAVAVGVLGAGAIALWMSFGGSTSELPPLPKSSTTSMLAPTPAATTGIASQTTATPGAASPADAAAPAPIGITTLPPRTGEGPAAADRPTFYQPLPARDGADAEAPRRTGFSELAQAEHQAHLEGVQARAEKLKLEKTKARLEREALEKNPARLFRDKDSESTSRSAAPIAGLPRTPPPLIATAPIPLPAGGPAAPAPDPAPQMRVKMVTLEPTPEALIETVEGADRGGSFTVRAGERFPLFVVTAIEARGVTISANGKGYFYPVGGRALGMTPPTPGARPLTPAVR